MDIDNKIYKKWVAELEKRQKELKPLGILLKEIKEITKQCESARDSLREGVLRCKNSDDQSRKESLKILHSICVNELKEAHNENDILRKGQVLKTFDELRKKCTEFSLIADKYNASLHAFVNLMSSKGATENGGGNGEVHETAEEVDKGIILQFLSDNIPMYERSEVENVSLIGSGSQGMSYLAKIKHLPNKVVVKYFNRNIPVWKEDVAREMFYLTTGLSHPNIVKFHGFVVDMKKKIFGPKKRPLPIGIVLELCECGTLTTAIHDPLVSYNVVRLALQAASALVSIHKKGVIHRDVKPHNMLLKDNRKTLKLCDFGFAKEENCAHTLVGTPLYQAPEIHLGNTNYSSKIDVYSLGICLIEMVLRDSIPETQDNAMEMTKDIKQEALRNLCRRMIDLKPENRPTMEEVYEKLERIEKSEPQYP